MTSAILAGGCRTAGRRKTGELVVETSVVMVTNLLLCAQIVDRARDEAANYRFTYAQPIPLKVTSVELSRDVL